RRYDTLAPEVLNLLRHIASTAERLGRVGSVSVCGEIAGRPLEAMALLGLGFTSLSMHASMIGPVKMMVRSLDTRALQPLVVKLCSGRESSTRTALTEFADSHSVSTGRS